jgi:hypothetical protein
MLAEQSHRRVLSVRAAKNVRQRGSKFFRQPVGEVRPRIPLMPTRCYGESEQLIDQVIFSEPTGYERNLYVIYKVPNHI